MNIYSQSLFSQSKLTLGTNQSDKSKNNPLPTSQSHQPTRLGSQQQTQGSADALTIAQRYRTVPRNGIQPLRITDPEGNEVTLRPVAELPECYRGMFNFPYFNIVQSKIFDSAVHSDDPVVLCAPTGSGKTVLFELALVRLLMHCATEEISLKKVTVIYMAPIKALCSERFNDWREKFESFGITCQELTGDSLTDDFYSLKDASLIFTTPEKWDSMTRRWKDNKSFIKQIRLFLIDEIHLLNDGTRGATVEAVVSRMKLMLAQLHNNAPNKLRVVAVSATMANVCDIAEWLGCKSKPAVYYKMSDKYRPVPLQRHVYGYHYNGGGDFKFDYSLNYKLPDIISRHSKSRPTLVFVSTRKGTQQTAEMISKSIPFVLSYECRQHIEAVMQTLRDTALRDCLRRGVGFHNAGLAFTERKSVEDLFRNGHLLVLVSTSTLAMGVNLPAHLVVIKSTQHYTSNGLQEYTESELLQMIGRAGRPQFDTTATAVIMTKQQHQMKYEKLVGGKQLIESSLHRNLIEHLNAEIVLGTIPQLSVALDWLKATFLYVRIIKNPAHYGLKGHQTRGSIEAYLQQLCVRQLHLLQEVGLIASECGSDRHILSTEPGKLMARYCVSYNTMSKVRQLTGQETQQQLVEFLASCQEFSDIQLRVSEKKVLNELNKSKVGQLRYPMKGKIKTCAMKVCCLIQAELGCLPMSEFSLVQDTTKVFRTASRITKCLVELYLGSKNADCLYNAVILNKCVCSHLWENSAFISKQLPGIGIKNATSLANAGVHKFSKLLDLHPREIELSYSDLQDAIGLKPHGRLMTDKYSQLTTSSSNYLEICNRNPPFGNGIVDSIKRLPKYEMAIDQQTENLQVQRATIHVALRLANADEIKSKSMEKHHSVMLLIYDKDNIVALATKIFDMSLLRDNMWSRTIIVSRATQGDELTVCLLSLSWVGLDICSIFVPKYSQPAFTHFRQIIESNVQNASAAEQSLADVQTQPTTSSKCTQPLNSACAHRCHNKQTCGHLCCKSKQLQRSVSGGAMPIGGNLPLQSTEPSSHRADSGLPAGGQQRNSISYKLGQFVRAQPRSYPVASVAKSNSSYLKAMKLTSSVGQRTFGNFDILGKGSVVSEETINSSESDVSITHPATSNRQNNVESYDGADICSQRYTPGTQASTPAVRHAPQFTATNPPWPHSHSYNASLTATQPSPSARIDSGTEDTRVFRVEEKETIHAEKEVELSYSHDADNSSISYSPVTASLQPIIAPNSYLESHEEDDRQEQVAASAPPHSKPFGSVTSGVKGVWADDNMKHQFSNSFAGESVNSKKTVSFGSSTNLQIPEHYRHPASSLSWRVANSHAKPLSTHLTTVQTECGVPRDGYITARNESDVNLVETDPISQLSSTETTVRCQRTSTLAFSVNTSSPSNPGLYWLQKLRPTSSLRSSSDRADINIASRATSNDRAAINIAPRATSSDRAAINIAPRATSSDRAAINIAPRATSSDRAAINIAPRATSSDRAAINIAPRATSSDIAAINIAPRATSSDRAAINIAPHATSCDRSAINIATHSTSSYRSAINIAPHATSSDRSAISLPFYAMTSDRTTPDATTNGEHSVSSDCKQSNLPTQPFESIHLSPTSQPPSNIVCSQTSANTRSKSYVFKTSNLPTTNAEEFSSANPMMSYRQPANPRQQSLTSEPNKQTFFTSGHISGDEAVGKFVEYDRKGGNNRSTATGTSRLRATDPRPLLMDSLGCTLSQAAAESITSGLASCSDGHDCINAIDNSFGGFFQSDNAAERKANFGSDVLNAIGSNKPSIFGQTLKRKAGKANPTATVKPMIKSVNKPTVDRKPDQLPHQNVPNKETSSEDSDEISAFDGLELLIRLKKRPRRTTPED